MEAGSLYQDEILNNSDKALHYDTEGIRQVLSGEIHIRDKKCDIHWRASILPGGRYRKA